MEGGDTLRSCVNDDRVLVDALKNLLPQHQAQNDATLVLFRGTSRNERRYRCYGHSWTDDLSVARSHATKAPHDGSRVVLEANASSQAIICALWQASDSFREREYVVDRRLLSEIRVKEEVQGPVRASGERPTYSDEMLMVGKFVSLRRV